jgi:ribonuclease T1
MLKFPPRILLWLLPCMALAASLPFAAHARGPTDTQGVVAAETLPVEARATLQRIKQGGPFPYAKDGATFGNREHRLPPRSRGWYREYTVPTPGSRDRGARRIIASRDGIYYYSDDHYRSLRRIGE